MVPSRLASRSNVWAATARFPTVWIAETTSSLVSQFSHWPYASEVWVPGWSTLSTCKRNRWKFPAVSTSSANCPRIHTFAARVGVRPAVWTWVAKFVVERAIGASVHENVESSNLFRFNAKTEEYERGYVHAASHRDSCVNVFDTAVSENTRDRVCT